MRTEVVDYADVPDRFKTKTTREVRGSGAFVKRVQFFIKMA